MNRLIASVLVALVASGCGNAGSDSTTPPSGTSSELPDGRDGVILTITEDGGFVPVEFSLQRVPRFVVRSDGTVVAPTGEQFSYPGPTLPSLAVSDVSRSVIDDVLAFVADLDLADTEALDINNSPNVADAPTTTVYYYDDEGEHRLSIYALGMEQGGDAREAIVQSMINELDSAVRSADSTPYVPSALEIYVTDDLLPEAEDVAEPWPLPVGVPGMRADVFGTFSCTILTGEDAETVASTLAGTDQTTTWESDGVGYRILGRPLLTDDGMC